MSLRSIAALLSILLVACSGNSGGGGGGSGGGAGGGSAGGSGGGGAGGSAGGGSAGGAGGAGGGSGGGSTGPTVQATDLGEGRCTGVDDAGDAIGTDASGAAFLLSGGNKTLLGPIGSAAGTHPVAIDRGGARIAGFGLTQSSRSAALFAGGAWSTPAALSGIWAQPAALNASGALAGTTQAGTLDAGVPNLRAFLFAGGALTDLGTLGGATAAAFGLSEDGKVTGISLTQAEDTHAFLYSGGRMIDLGTLGGTSSAGYGVNSSGTVVGSSELASGAGHAFVYQSGAMSDLNLGQPMSDARGVSEAGAIAGNWQTSDGTVVPFVMIGAQIIQLKINDSSSAPWASAKLEAISAGGAMIGWGRPAGAANAHCVLWRVQ